MRTEPARVPGQPAAARQTLTHCPLCRHEHFSYQFTQGGLPIVRCDGCRLLLRNPQPSDDELAAVYGEDYFFGTSAMPDEDNYEAEFARLKQATAAGYLDRVERYLGWDAAGRRGRRLLDLGTGLGDLLVEAQTRGYDIAGVEYSPSSVARANARLGGAVVREGTIETAGLEDGTFDVCMLSDVIEHTRDPMRVLDHVWRAPTRAARSSWRRPVSTAGRRGCSATGGWSSKRSTSSSSTARRFEVRAGARRFRAHPDRARPQDAQPRACSITSGDFQCRTVAARPRDRRGPSARAEAPAVARIASGIDVVARRAAQPPIDRRRARVSVVMPVFNEKRTFTEVIGRLLPKQIRTSISGSSSSKATRRTDPRDVRKLERHRA